MKKEVIFAFHGVRSFAAGGAFHKGHGILHLGYFGAVFIEGHGLYAAMAGVLLAMGLIGFLAGQVEG